MRILSDSLGGFYRETCTGQVSVAAAERLADTIRSGRDRALPSFLLPRRAASRRVASQWHNTTMGNPHHQPNDTPSTLTQSARMCDDYRNGGSWARRAVMGDHCPLQPGVTVGNQSGGDEDNPPVFRPSAMG
jgi:hypothetical protein